ncbi:putative Pyrroline-5-carboxylate reductase [Cocos nucifera]|nr:putative Pyrroline-5-carboxylate reductase [Cocos nucifera]
MPRRRKQPSSAMRGIFTRSQSEISLHRTRSGRDWASPDPGRRRRRLLASIARPPSPLPSSTGGDALLTSVKDLRTRRVFSPASIPIESSPPTATNKPDDDRPDGVDRLEKEATEEERNGQVDETSKIPGGSGDDFVQSTPPVGLISLGADTALVERETEVPLNDQRTDNLGSDIGSGDRAFGISPKGQRTDGKLDSGNPLKRREGLAPCSRSKLFRNPSSFSYRRLLPFLVDLEKESSSGLKILPCQNAVKVEKLMEEKPKPPHVDTLSKQLQLGGSEGSLTEKSSDGWNFDENPVNKNPSLKPSGEDVYDMTTTISPLPDSGNGRAMQVDEIKSETYFEDPILGSRMLHNSYLSPAVIHEDLSVDELAGNVRALSYLPAEVDVGCRMMLPLLNMDLKPLQREPQLETVHSAARHALAPKRGILKRYGRGCKGICMCLECATFRIHADRAYEFSRKQMDEADEIIVGLMKELVNLRNLVDKSITPMVGGGSSTILQLNQELLKRACQRASRAEEVANNRRRKMFNDLNIHCKIPGPRVTFAECVEQNIIP